LCYRFSYRGNRLICTKNTQGAQDRQQHRVHGMGLEGNLVIIVGHRSIDRQNKSDAKKTKQIKYVFLLLFVG